MEKPFYLIVNNANRILKGFQSKEDAMLVADNLNEYSNQHGIENYCKVIDLSDASVTDEMIVDFMLRKYVAIKYKNNTH